MPLVFTRDEIREYLAEMGYGNLNEDDLNHFVKDLRKLIKMESRKRRRIRLGHTGHTHSELSSTADDEENSMKDSENIDDLSTFTPIPKPNDKQIDTLRSSRDSQNLLYTPKTRRKPFSETSDSTPYSTTTTTTSGQYSVETSADNDVVKTQNSNGTVSPLLQIRIPLTDNVSNKFNEIRSNRPQSSTTAVDRGGPSINNKFSPNDERLEQRESRIRENHVPDDAISETGSTDSVVELDINKSVSSTESLSDMDLLDLLEHILKSDVNTETSEEGADNKQKLQLPPKAIGRDPVALYHWYKAFWDKQKAPGEDRHMQLRWNVRAGTVGKYPCNADGVRINYLPLNPVKQKKKTCVY